MTDAKKLAKAREQVMTARRFMEETMPGKYEKASITDVLHVEHYLQQQGVFSQEADKDSLWKEIMGHIAAARREPDDYAAEIARSGPLGDLDAFYEFGADCKDPSCTVHDGTTLTQENVRSRLQSLVSTHPALNTADVNEKERLLQMLTNPHSSFTILKSGVLIRGAMFSAEFN